MNKNKIEEVITWVNSLEDNGKQYDSFQKKEAVLSVFVSNYINVERNNHNHNF